MAEKTKYGVYLNRKMFYTNSREQAEKLAKQKTVETEKLKTEEREKTKGKGK